MKTACFITGFLLLVIAVALPLEFIGDNYLMSAHMITHVLILLIAAPLMIAGIPAGLSSHFICRLSGFLSGHPLISWMSGVCIMWFWHIPIIFNKVYGGIPDQNGIVGINHLLQ